MATEYTLNLADRDGRNSGYIKYSISPDYSRGIVPGETVTITGKARWDREKIRSVSYRIYYSADGGTAYFDGYTNVTIVTRTEGSFSLSFQIPDRVFSTFPDRAGHPPFDTSGNGCHFNVSVQRHGGWGDFDSSQLDTRLTLLKYRLNPQVTALSFRRADAAGGRANDGLYLMCESLKCSLDPQAKQADVTTATVAIRRVDSGTIVKSVALTAAQLSAVLGSGYSETKPTLFAGVSLELGKEYDVVLTLGDAYDSSTCALRISRANAVVDFHPNGFAVGQFSNATPEKPLFEVAPTHKSALYGGVENFGAGALCTASQQALGIQSGSDSITVAQSSTTFHTVAFPKPFSAAPVVFTMDTYRFGTLKGLQIKANCVSATATSFEYMLTNETTASRDIVVNWIAIGPVGGAAASDPGLAPPEIVDDTPYADVGIARADYVAMMAGVEIPADAGAADAPGAQGDPGSSEAPGLEEPQHSEKFALVKLYFDADCWSEQMVRSAAGRWITEDEAEQILATHEESEQR